MSRFRTSISTSVFTPLPALRLPLSNGSGTARTLSDQELAQALVTDQPKRPRICDLSGYLHCSVIGTCLSTTELRQILVKLEIEGANGASDHEIHSKGVALAGKRSPAAKLLSKALDRRHRLTLNQFGRADTAAQVRRLWDEAMQRGDIPGAYWAAITHPAANDELIRHVFGEVHMLSHLVGAANRADIRRLNQLEAEKAKLEEKVERQQAQLRDAITERDTTIRNLNQALCRALSAERQTEEIGSADSERQTLVKLVENLERRLSAETQRRARADERLAALEAKLLEERRLHAVARLQADTLRAELAVLETGMAPMSADGNSVADENPDLNGLSLLYVGGRADHVSRLRDTAERAGATLAHHDGGVEESSGLLAGLIQRADAVLFPVDCVSHQATWIVKRLCRQAAKPFFPLRSAGHGSFLAALRDPALSGLSRNEAQ